MNPCTEQPRWEPDSESAVIVLEGRLYVLRVTRASLVNGWNETGGSLWDYSVTLSTAGAGLESAGRGGNFPTRGKARREAEKAARAHAAVRAASKERAS